MLEKAGKAFHSMNVYGYILEDILWEPEKAAKSLKAGNLGKDAT